MSKSAKTSKKSGKDPKPSMPKGSATSKKSKGADKSKKSKGAKKLRDTGGVRGVWPRVDEPVLPEEAQLVGGLAALVEDEAAADSLLRVEPVAEQVGDGQLRAPDSTDEDRIGDTVQPPVTDTEQVPDAPAEDCVEDDAGDPAGDADSPADDEEFEGGARWLAPPVSVEEIRDRLGRALQARTLVRVRRWIPDSDAVSGFVTALNQDWVLLAAFDGTIALDGWTALRIADIYAVTTLARADSFEVRALELRGYWPPFSPDGIDLTDTVSVIRSAAGSAPLVGLELELDRPDLWWVGAVVDVGPDTIALLEIDEHAQWATLPTLFDTADITRVDVGGRYAEALHLIGGSPPVDS